MFKNGRERIMGKVCKKWISYLLVSVMLLSMLPSLPAKAAEKGANLVPSIESDGQVTFYYRGDGTEEEVYVKGSWDVSWGSYFYMTESENDFWSVTSTGLEAGKSYEYGIMAKKLVEGELQEVWVDQPNKSATGGNPKIIRNPGINENGTVTFYYYPSSGEAAEDIKVTYTDGGGQSAEIGFAQDVNYPTLYSATTGVLNGTYTYELSVGGTAIPGYNSAADTFTAGTAPPVDPSKQSPVIDGGNVTFYYYGPTASEVKLAGNMTDWGDGARPMTYDSATGYWSIGLTEQRNGNYEYKFIVNGSSWQKDPLNMGTGENSTYTVTDGYVPDVISPVINGKSVTFYYKGDPADTVVLAGDMNGWKNEGEGADRMTDYDASSGLWSMTLRLEPGSYAYKYVVNGQWITDPANVNPIVEGNSTFTVAELPDGYYTYNIYYYDTKHSGLKDAALWIWENGGAAGQEYRFTSQETIDGHTWLKAELDLNLSKPSVIPKKYSSGTVDWGWQDVTREHDFTGASVRDMYLIFGDSTVYTECPDLSAVSDEERYVIVEYTRPGGDYDGWNIYTWNSGYGSEVAVPFETEADGKAVAKVPVTKSVTDLSFCVRRSETGNPWAEKDGGDHSVKIPANQTIAKARFVQNKGVTEILPYNIGYEIDTASGSVSFYYRDNALFRDGKQAELAGKVRVCIDGVPGAESAETIYDMTYDTKNERYVYVYNSLTEGEHTYCYFIDGERKLDAYNEKTDATGLMSIYEYYSFAAQVKTSLMNAGMDYNDNNLLTISVTDDQGQTIEEMEAAEITADLSSLGGGVTAVDPQLMALSFGVHHSTAVGRAALPVTVKDQYGNIYTGNAEVEIKAREKGTDFDWDEAVIYFAVTDRFFDGDETNNDPDGIGDYDLSANGSSSYHGGDFAGLTQKLDYLQELGVNTVWITPIVENYMADGLTTDVAGIKSYGYHGYWASDFEKLNPHLGSKADLHTLVDELHGRGMKLMVDVVLNHSGYDTNGTNITGYFNGKLPDKGMLRNAQNTVSGSEVQDSLAGLPDFVTEDADVRSLLIAWQSAWVSEFNIDYFRVDTVKHVEDTTWAAFKNALTSIDPDFKMIGEQSGAGYATSAGKLRTGGMDSLLDFDFNDKAMDFTTGKIGEVESFLDKRNEEIDNTAMMGSFLGSHDEDGLRYRLQEEKGMSEEESYDAMKVAAALQITAKGQPVIYYGEEIGLTGANNYPYQTNRYDFDWSLANDDNDMLSHYRALLSIRQDYSDVFAKGDRSTIRVSENDGYDIFARSYKGTDLYVALQTKSQAQQVEFRMGKAGDTVTDLYGGNKYKVAADGNVRITIPAASDGGCAILAVTDSVKEPEKPVTPETNKPGAKPDTGSNASGSSGASAGAGGGSPQIAADWNRITADLRSQTAAGGNNGGKALVRNVLTGNNIIVPSDIFQILSGQKMTLAMHTGENLAFSISSENIPRTMKNSSLNLTVRQGKAAIPAALIGEKVKNTVADRQISLAGRDSFGMVVNMHLALGAENANNYANLYRYNEQRGQMDYLGSFRITDNGQAMFGITGGAEYLITVTKELPAEKAGGVYTVMKGDTLSDIAARFGVKLRDLMAANPGITNADRIRQGQRVQLP